MIRLTFVDGSQHHFYDPHIIENGLWMSAFDNETHMMTYIPTSCIHKFVDLGKASSEKIKK